MSYHPPDTRPYTSYYPRPPGSSGTGDNRIHHSSHGPPPPLESPSFHHEMPAPPGSSHGYPAQAPPPPAPAQAQAQGQAPITPVSGGGAASYPPPPPPSSGQFYGLASNPSEHMPSPPPSSNGGRPGEQVLTFTPDGQPIVPVGVSGGKMFRCRGYGECDKVFTRSEHLARHVRKHTGERPFPCHCGKAFSRLDNLRQHAATVHADHAALNEAMLNSLAPVHASLSQKAGKEQRKRGEIVEVPKNAVERPRHNEFRTGRGGTQQPGSEFGEFPPPGWDDRPRTGYAQPYPFPEQGQAPDNGGPSRRPPSSGYAAYPYGYDQNRPNTGGGPPPPGPDGQHAMPYPYRPVSSSGRELPVPGHYSESEPPNSAHGPPQSPMYPPVPPNQWSSSPPHSATYGQQPHESVYPPQPSAEGYYDHQQQQHQQHYGPPPPGSSSGSYAYPGGYYPPGQGGVAPHAQGQYAPYPYPGNAPPDSPFQYSAPNADQQQYPYGPAGAAYSGDRKRRADEEAGDDARKHARPASAVPQNLNDAIRDDGHADPLWLPPATERRSSLAISALLGSPTLPSRPRPAGDASGVPSATEGATYPPQPYPYHPASHDAGGETANSSVSATPVKDENGRTKSEVTA